MGKALHYRSLAWDLLQIIGSGAILASLFVAPNVGLALKPFLRGNDPYARREWERKRVQVALRRLRDRRCVQLIQKGNEMYLAVTEYGKARLKKFEFDAVTLPEQPRRWDRIWRMVIFDIPERKKRARKVLRDKLDELGFLPLQKSVFVYPYSCEDEVDFLLQFLDVDRYVHCIKAAALGSAEARARRHFGLL